MAQRILVVDDDLAPEFARLPIIMLTARADEVDRVVGFEIGADENRVRVADTGIGIPRSDQERIFERFYRVDTSRSRALGGTGLGLSIVKHLVRRMGGEIGVESEPGKGSTFSFWLPKANRDSV